MEPFITATILFSALNSLRDAASLSCNGDWPIQIEKVVVVWIFALQGGLFVSINPLRL